MKRTGLFILLCLVWEAEFASLSRDTALNQLGTEEQLQSSIQDLVGELGNLIQARSSGSFRNGPIINPQDYDLEGLQRRVLRFFKRPGSDDSGSQDEDDSFADLALGPAVQPLPGFNNGGDLYDVTEETDTSSEEETESLESSDEETEETDTSSEEETESLESNSASDKKPKKFGGFLGRPKNPIKLLDSTLDTVVVNPLTNLLTAPVGTLGTVLDTAVNPLLNTVGVPAVARPSTLLNTLLFPVDSLLSTTGRVTGFTLNTLLGNYPLLKKVTSELSELILDCFSFLPGELEEKIAERIRIFDKRENGENAREKRLFKTTRFVDRFVKEYPTLTQLIIEIYRYTNNVSGLSGVLSQVPGVGKLVDNPVGDVLGRVPILG